MPSDSGLLIGVALGVGAVLLGALFEYFHRIYSDRHLRLWALSWLAAGVHMVLDFVPAYFAVDISLGGEFGRLFTGYAHVGLLAWGVYEAGTRSQVSSRPVRVGAAGIVVLALTGAAFAPGTEAGNPFATPLLYIAVTGTAYLATGAWLFRGRRLGGLGSVVVSVAFMVHGAFQFVAAYPGLQVESMTIIAMAALAQMIVEFGIALGLVIWLLEQARDQAVSIHRGQELSLRRFRRLLERGWDLVELRHGDGSVDWVSQSVERVLGVDIADYVSTEPLESVHPDDRPAMRKLLSGRFPSQDPTPIRMLGGDGSYRQLESVCVDLTADSEVGAFVVTSRDVTDRYALQRELLDASGRERRELGRDLHDGLGQLLTGIGFRVAQLEGALERGRDGTLELAVEIKDLVKSAVTQADALARGLSPVSVQAAGIVSALESLADTLRIRYGAVATVERVDVLINDPEVANQVFMIAQEASLSAVKVHSSSALRLGIARSADGGVLYVRANRPRENPVGEVRRATMTDRILHHRAAVIDASLDIVEADEYGHSVICRFHRGGVERADLNRAG